MAVFALVELELHGLPQVMISEIAQDVLRVDDTAKVGKGLRQPVGRKGPWGYCQPGKIAASPCVINSTAIAAMSNPMI